MRTAECVTPKHPDKMCDQISDAILDVCLSTDPKSRVAIETMGGHGKVVVMGEVTSELGFRQVDVQEAIKRITGKDLEVTINVVEQSPEIANGVDTGGAGDQGIMKGYACNDNDEMIPEEMYLARSLAQFIYKDHPYDGKTQVTLDEDGKVKTIVASFQNTEASSLRFAIGQWFNHLEEIGHPVECVEYENGFLGGGVHANPAGDWAQGGFDADTGLTGRKLAVDNYGPEIPLGGGCFSGKDATKVDRSAAYMARYIAVNYLRALGASEVEVKLAYAIGKADPVMATVVSTDYDGKKRTQEVDRKRFNLTPNGIIEFLDLRKPQFEATARWGHFGLGNSWDKIDTEVLNTTNHD
jgi:S-adenosylmethionine synthetase